MATRILITLAALAAISSPAYAAPVCHIIVADDRASTLEIYWHEVAHCNGWVHADQNHQGKPKKGYQSPKPPAKFLKPYPNLDVQWVTTTEALQLCGSYGCYYFD